MTEAATQRTRTLACDLLAQAIMSRFHTPTRSAPLPPASDGYAGFDDTDVWSLGVVLAFIVSVSALLWLGVFVALSLAIAKG